MTTYTGTNGNDSFIGTSGVDGFNFSTNILGQDSADGGLGVDTLTLTYASLTKSDYSSSISSNAGTFSGYISGDGSDYLSFSNMEKLNISLTSGDDYIYVDAAALATAGTTLSLNGGVGNDTLSLDLSAFTGKTFTVAADGSVSTTVAGLIVSNFENYTIRLGAGTNSVITGAGNDFITGGAGNDTLNGGAGNDTITGAAGNDRITGGAGNDTLYGDGGTNVLSGGDDEDNIYSTGGVDAVYGGTGSDHWYGDYTAASANLTFNFNERTGAGSLTGGTFLVGVEAVDLTTGGGADLFTITLDKSVFDSSLSGGAGIDTLTMSAAGQTSYSNFSNLSSNGAGGFNGYIGGSSNYIYDFEKLNLTLSDDDSYISVDSSPLLSGATLDLNGGVGNDTLNLDLSAFTGKTFTVAADGSVSSTVAGLTVSNFENYNLLLGAGTNSVTTGAGNDTIAGGVGNDTLNGGKGSDTLSGNGGSNTLNGGDDDDQIYSTGGVDTVNGGAGTDRWTGDYSAATTNLTFSYNGTTGAGSLTDGTTLTAIETASLTTGSGADSFMINGGKVTFSNSNLDAGGGTDTLTLSQAGQTSPSYYYSTYLSSNGAGGFNGYGNSGHQNFANFEKINLTLSDDDNTIQVDAAPLLLGATLNLNGGVGNDTLYLDLSMFTGKTFTVATNGSVSSTVTGLTLTNFENYNLTLGAGTNSVTTGAGNDSITGETGNDTINGGAGIDALYGNGGTNSLSGGDGDDQFYSSGGVDTVNGGAGDDQWHGNYSTSSKNLTFSYDATTGTGNLTGGTTLTAIETASLTTGSGADSFNITGSNTWVYRNFIANGGIDTFTLSEAGQTGYSDYYSNHLYSSGSGGFSGYVNGYEYLYEFEKINLTLSDDDSYLEVDAAPLLSGATLNLNGGVGNDTLSLDLSAFTGKTFTVAANGSVSSTVTGLTLTNFESYHLTLGAGANSVTTGAGNDTIIGGAGNDTINGGDGSDTLYGNGGTNSLSGGNDADAIYSTGGADTVNGGAGADYWSGDYSAASTNLTFSYNATTGSGNLTGGTTLAAIEAISLRTGSGADSFTLTGSNATFNSGNLDAGGGTDTLTLSQAGQTGIYYASLYSNGSGGFNGYANYNASNYLYNFEKINLTLSDDDNSISVDASPLLTGATLNLNGGVGNDTLSLDLSAFTDKTFTVAANGSVSTTVIGLTVSNFEIYNITLGDGTNSVTTGAGNDSITGGAGNDVIDGGAGNDYLDGGNGTDTVSYGTAAAGITLTLDAGYQPIATTEYDYVYNFENASGSAFNDTIAGTGGNNVLVGGAGVDTLSYANAGAGVTVNLATTAQQNTVGAGLDTVSGFENLTGSAYNDTLTGNASANVIAGGDGNDVMNGAAGIDTLSYADAGAGVTVSLALTAQQNTGGGGLDTISSFENLIGSSNGDSLTGSTAANVITGGQGDDVINAGAGTDTAAYSGAWGDYDVSLVGGTITVVDRRGIDGTDTLTSIENLAFSNGTFTVAQIANFAPVAVNDSAGGVVEQGSSTAGQSSASGNALANDSDPNQQTPALNETLSVNGIVAGDGSGGFNTVSGGPTSVVGTYGTLTINPDGTYSYALDNSLAATDALAQGQAASDLFAYRLADAHGLTSTAQITIGITGSDDVVVPSTLTAAADSLYLTTGLASSIDAAVLLANDSGGAGETLSVTGLSNITGGSAAIVGGKLVITASASSGGFDYTLNGSNGGSTTGHVTFASVATSSAANTIVAPAGYTAADLQGQSGNDSLTGTDGTDHLVGGIGNDTLTGGLGADVLDGGAGNDIFVVDASDVLIEAAGGGTDLVRTAESSYTLLTNFENLAYIGTGTFTGTGNAVANALTGGSGADALYGLAGNDTLVGGLGDDYLDGGVGTDLASYATATGSVTVNLTAGTATGAAGQDTLVAIENITGSASADTLTGNAAVNTILGGAGNDSIDGGGGNDKIDGGLGADTMTGGAGNDSFTVDNVGDVVIEGVGGGTDAVSTALASYTLGTNLENLTGTTKTGFVGTGNDAANTITGGIGNDTLNGGTGNDHLDGGANNDTLNGGAGTDIMTGGTGADIFGFAKVTDFGPLGSLDDILDFSGLDGDKISLKSIDPDAVLTGDQSFTFIGTDAFTTGAHSTYEVRYQDNGAGDLLVQLDTNRDGNADYAFLVHATSLSSSYFVL